MKFLIISPLVFVIYEDGLWKFQDLIIFITQDMLTYMSHTNTLPRYFIYIQTICLSRLHGCDATIIDFDILISRLILFPSIVVFVCLLSISTIISAAGRLSHWHSFPDYWYHPYHHSPGSGLRLIQYNRMLLKHFEHLRCSVYIIKWLTRTEQGHEDIWCELCNVTNLIPISPYCFMVAFDTKCHVNSYFWLTYLTRHPHSVSLSLILRGKNDVRNVQVPRCLVWSLVPNFRARF